MIRDLPARAQLADELLEEGLPAFLDAERRQGKGWDSIAHELAFRTERRIEVNGVTLSDWADKLAQQAAS